MAHSNKYVIKYLCTNMYEKPNATELNCITIALFASLLHPLSDNRLPNHEKRPEIVYLTALLSSLKCCHLNTYKVLFVRVIQVINYDQIHLIIHPSEGSHQLTTELLVVVVMSNSIKVT